jgi:hypothetical protein
LHEWAETFERYWKNQLNRIKERAEAKMKQIPGTDQNAAKE